MNRPLRFLLFTALYLSGGFVVFGQLMLDPKMKEIESLSRQVAELHQQGQNTQALVLAQQELELSKDAYGLNHSETASSFNDVGGMYEALGDFSNAEAMFKSGLEIREKLLGPNHRLTARTLNNLGVLYIKMRQYTNAEPLLLRSLAINIAVLGTNDTATVMSLDSLGNLYLAQKNYVKGKEAFRQAFSICQTMYGPDSFTTASSLNNLAAVDLYSGNLSAAEPEFQQVLAIYEKANGPDALTTASALQSLGLLYHQMEDLAKSESYFQRALAIQEKAPGPDQLATANTLGGLGMVYMDMGDYVKALQLYQRVLAIQEKAYGPNHPVVAETLARLAGICTVTGNLTLAAELDRRVLVVDKIVYGTEHPKVAIDRLSLGTIYAQQGDLPEARKFFEEALRVQQKVFGPDNAEVAATLNALAGIDIKSGNYTNAESLLLRAQHMYEKAGNKDNALLAIHYGNLALNYFEQHKTNEMLQYADKAEQAHLKVLENILSFTSEQQRLTYTAQNDPYVFFAAVNDGPRMAQTVLRHKAVVLDSLLEDRLVARASENPEDQNLVKQLVAAKQQMAELSMTPQKDQTADVLKKRAETNDALSFQIEQMEGALAQKVAGFGHARRALTCTVDQVQKMIPPQTVLLEFVHYTAYLDQQQRQPRYGVVLLTAKGEPKWINLGAAGEIETNILHYQRDIRGADRTDDAGFSQLLSQIYKQTLEPIEAQLPADTKTIVISPDGWLNFISFATLLVSSNQFLAEKYTIRYVTSGRDLLQAHVEPASQDAVFFAAPDYAAGGLITIPRTGLQLPPLPFLAKNTYDIIAEIKSWNWPVKIYARAEATESNLYNVHSPRILQFSTHGFLLPENINVPKPVGLKNLLAEPKTSSSAVVLKNPMYRNGIALAGAQVTLDAWKRGEVRPTGNDGMLMADEAGNLDLRGTWLVVLAACDSGTGDARFGEGVMGLRRGFAQAGAQNLMMTLWPVFDVPSGELLLDFYSSLHQNNDPAKALAETQRDSLIKFRTKYGLLPAVVLAGGFILSSQGPLAAQ